MPAIAAILGQVLMGFIGKLVTADFFEWVILWAARKYVESTETTADDEWFAKISETLSKGK